MKVEVIQSIQDFLINKINPVFIIVFGSYAKKTMKDTSDLDVAYYCDDAPDPYENFMIAQELADLIKIEVDLIDIKKASTVFKAQIYSAGIIIYSKDDTLLRINQMMAFTMYAKLNEEREPILKKIRESGSVYEK